MTRNLEDEINDLINRHNELWSYEYTGLIRKDRTAYMRHLIELELSERGYSLEGLKLK